MKQLNLIFSLLLLAAIPVMSQTKQCATDEVLQQRLQDDPTLQARIDSMEQAMQELISERGYTEDYSQLKLPLIPGFDPTGDPTVDVQNFAKAKQELYAKDPELYDQLTTKQTTNKDKR